MHCESHPIKTPTKYSVKTPVFDDHGQIEVLKKSIKNPDWYCRDWKYLLKQRCRLKCLMHDAQSAVIKTAPLHSNNAPRYRN